MNLPIYEQTRRDVPCEWLYDDDMPEPPSRWDTYVGYFWAVALVVMIVGPAYVALIGVQS